MRARTRPPGLVSQSASASRAAGPAGGWRPRPRHDAGSVQPARRSGTWHRPQRPDTAGTVRRVQGEQAIDALSVQEVHHRRVRSRSTFTERALPLAFISSADQGGQAGAVDAAHAPAGRRPAVHPGGGAGWRRGRRGRAGGRELAVETAARSSSRQARSGCRARRPSVGILRPPGRQASASRYTPEASLRFPPDVVGMPPLCCGSVTFTTVTA